MLATIVAKAVQLSGTDAGAIYVFDEAQQQFRLSATYGMGEALIAAIRDQRIGAGETADAAGRFAVADALQVPDLRQEPSSPVLELSCAPATGRCWLCRCCAATPSSAPWWSGGKRHRHVPGGQDRPAADLRGPIGAGDPERAAVP